MIVPFGISSAFYAGSDKEHNAVMLKCLLDTLIALNLDYLRTMARNGKTVPHLYESGVVYGRTLSWDTIPVLYEMGFGDCKSLTAAFCADLRMRGFNCEPCFRFQPRPDGGIDYHILVQTDGTASFRGQQIEVWHDPSKVLGMCATAFS